MALTLSLSRRERGPKMQDARAAKGHGNSGPHPLPLSRFSGEGTRERRPSP